MHAQINCSLAPHTPLHTHKFFPNFLSSLSPSVILSKTMSKQPSCKKVCGPSKRAMGKSWEIKGGNHFEMVVVAGVL